MRDEIRTPAEIYDAQFVPAVFGPWGRRIAREAGIRPGDRVLDVACGTGALTLAAAEIAGPTGAVVGLDINPDMLGVARRKPAQIEWLEGRAEALPFPDDGFDAVVSQFGMMFFDDTSKALAEMRRVLRPGGRMAVAVCDAVEHSRGYAALAGLLDRLFRREVGDSFRAPFALGDAGVLRRICEAAGLADAEIVRRDGTVRFASIDALVATERACVWTLGGLLDDDQFERLVREARTVLRPFEAEGGGIAFEMPTLVVRARSR